MSSQKDQLMPHFLGKIHHPALGIRIPEMVLPGMFASLRKHRTAATMMLSFGRETAPQAVIDAPPGSYEITLGHTGTSIRNYQNEAMKGARKYGVPIEIEADHLIVIGSSASAVKRIAGVHVSEHLSMEQLEKSLAYNFSAVDEAVEHGHVDVFTTDTSDLFWLEADNLSADELTRAFSKKFSAEKQSYYLQTFANKNSLFRTQTGKEFSIQLTEADVKRLALKFHDSIDVNQRIYEYIQSHIQNPFGFEISMDETAAKTGVEELYFYLKEWTSRGLPVDFVAPNIGFKKRADYDGALSDLENLTAEHAAVARSFDGALLSIHSGSGTTPYSGKGAGTYDALLRATGNQLKYKISGVYYELFMELLAGFPKDIEERNLFEQIFASVQKYLENEIEINGLLATDLLKKQLEDYHRAVQENPERALDPRADFFRFHSYLAMNFRNSKGVRIFRNKLTTLYQFSKTYREKVNAEVEGLTDRLIEGLAFEDNLAESKK